MVELSNRREVLHLFLRGERLLILSLGIVFLDLQELLLWDPAWFHLLLWLFVRRLHLKLWLHELALLRLGLRLRNRGQLSEVHEWLGVSVFERVCPWCQRRLHIAAWCRTELHLRSRLHHRPLLLLLRLWNLGLLRKLKLILYLLWVVNIVQSRLGYGRKWLLLLLLIVVLQSLVGNIDD